MVVSEAVASAMTAERQRNIATAMAAHDWSHRWMSLLQTCGVTPDPRLLRRIDRLSASAKAGRRATHEP